MGVIISRITSGSMASKKSLLESDDEEDVTIEINKGYAQKYSSWREKEELQKLKTKYGEEIGESSSSSEEEDEDAEALTHNVDKSWFRALAAIRSNDPRIYQKDIKFFEDEEEEETNSHSDSSDTTEKSSSKKKKTDDKPMYMKDYERKLILEKGGKLSESEDEEEGIERKPGYYEEQEAIKKSIKKAMAECSSDEEDENILVKRIKTQKEKEEEEDEYIQFLKGNKKKEDLKKDKGIADDLAPLKEVYSRPDLNEDEKLLWNIVLDQGFRRKNKAKDEDWYAEQMAQLQEDEEDIEEQEQFEHKYNFRFEEPDQEYLKGFERNPTSTLRQKENKRAAKRQEIKDRKQKEKDKKQEEIRHLKNLKKKEILEKLDQLKEVTGNKDVGFSAKDIEEEFDPSAHDKMMQKYFGEEFYEEDELEKPQFEDDVDDYGDDDEDWDAWQGRSEDKPQQAGSNADEEGQPGCSGEGWNQGAYEDDEYDDSKFNMDADYDPSQATYTSGKKKHKSKFRQVIERKKPTFDEVCAKYEGSDHPFGDYIDEFFKLDCEDIIAGDVRCRFRYRKTVANDYGLSVKEILKCPDKELNAWASMKKLSQFRNEDDELYEVRKYKKAKMKKKKLNIMPSLKDTSDTLEQEMDEDQEPGHASQNLNENDEENDFDQSEMDDSLQKNSGLDDNKTQKKKSRKRKVDSSDNNTSVASDFSPQKKKPKKETTDSADDSQISPEKKKKKKKRKSGVEISDKSQENLNSAAEEGERVLKMKADHFPADGGDVETSQKKKKKKQQGEGSKSPAKDSNKKKGKGKQAKRKQAKRPHKKGFQAGDQMSSSRLAALHIDPRKFKYTKHKILPSSTDHD